MRLGKGQMSQNAIALLVTLGGLVDYFRSVTGCNLRRTCPDRGAG